MSNKKLKLKKPKEVLPTNFDLSQNIHVSVTVQDVINHLDFLQDIDEMGQDKFYNEQFVQNAIRRYQKFWIPLIVSLSDDHENDLNDAYFRPWKCSLSTNIWKEVKMLPAMNQFNEFYFMYYEGYFLLTYDRVILVYCPTITELNIALDML